MGNFFAVLNGIAAVIGLIAVFYPSVFVFEKKEESQVIVVDNKPKYEKLKLTVNTGKDFDQFLDFFEARIKDNKPFVIDTYPCKDNVGEPAKFTIKNRTYEKGSSPPTNLKFNTYRADNFEDDAFMITNHPYFEDFSDEELDSFLKENNSTVEDIFAIDVEPNDSYHNACKIGLCSADVYRLPERIIEEVYKPETIGDCSNFSAYHIKMSLIYDSSVTAFGELVSNFKEATPIDFQTQE